MASYDFPIMASDSTAFFRPSIYLRTIPEQDNQIGFNTLFSTQKYWAQAGYNNFYGISIGAGGTVLNKVSLGALVEFGTSSSLNTKDASFEIIASYFLGNPQNRRQKVVNVFDTLEEDVVNLEAEEKTAEIEEDLENTQKMAAEEKNQEGQISDEILITEAAILAEAAAAEKKREEEAIADAEAKRIALNKEVKEREAAEELKRAELEREKTIKQKDSLVQVKKMEAIAAENSIKAKRRADSINTAKAAEALAVSEKIKIQEQDAIQKAKEELADRQKDEIVTDKVTPQAGEKYEEVLTEGDLEPGFYLIANVFGTKKYFDAFMQDLRKKGIEPGSFLRVRNNYNYAYLKRYATISAARRDRDNNFGGKYEGKTWIFRVVGK